MSVREQLLTWDDSKQNSKLTVTYGGDKLMDYPVVPSLEMVVLLQSVNPENALLSWFGENFA